MTRSTDLDIIAPDDPIQTTKAPELSPKKEKLSQPKTKKVSPLIKSPAPSASRESDFRQKVYELLRNQTKHPFSSLLARPKVFNFDSRNSDEEIILVLRRHWFTNISWVVIFFLMITAPLFVTQFPFLDFINTNLRIIIVLFWYLISFAIAFEQFLSWYFNVFILTEERVIDIDFDNLLYKNISEAQISMIQDITVSQGGVSQTLFNYGSVFIQTASEVPQIEVLKVPNPNLVLKVLQQMRSEEELETMEGRIK